MIEVTEPQVWTLIGGLESRLGSKIDALDRDVQAIARHVFGEPS